MISADLIPTTQLAGRVGGEHSWQVGLVVNTVGSWVGGEHSWQVGLVVNILSILNGTKLDNQIVGLLIFRFSK